jgi:hypothetical protein
MRILVDRFHLPGASLRSKAPYLISPNARRLQDQDEKRSLLWFGAQPDRPAQDPTHPPLGSLGAPRRPGQREELTCQVSLLGPRAHLTAPVISQLTGLIWVQPIHLLPPYSKWHRPPGGGTLSLLSRSG